MRDYLDDRSIKLRRERTNTPATGRPFLVAFVLCLLAGMLILLDRQGFITPLRNAVQALTAPVAQRLVELRGGVDQLAAAPRGEAALRERIAQLEQEKADLAADLLALEQARVDNEFLREQLAIEREQPWKLLGAEVTVRSPEAGRRIITIARGEREGVRPGMAVIGQSPGGPAALVGLVESVGSHTAEVLLITDIGSQISGRVLHNGRAEVGLVAGQWQRGSRLQLEQIDRTMALAVGDAVVTAGLSGALNLPLDLSAVPPAVPIGSIEQISTAEQYQVAALRPFVDPDQVRYVWVILSQDV